MANSEAGSSSDAAPVSQGEYEVFLNFRGEDTRYGFTDFLYNYLVDAGVRAFIDEEELPIGEVISEKLQEAINNTIIYIPIFSQTYASSKWCLRELALMMDNVTKSKDQKYIFPLFFHVKPDHVKLKKPLYEAYFKEHEKNYPDEVEAWKGALRNVDERKGWVVEKKTRQAMIVKSIVKEVLVKLKIKRKLVSKHLIGLDNPVKDLMEFLDVNHDDVRVIGVYGMGGMGKTTIAKVVFNRLCSYFGKCCSFLEDIRERSTKEGIVSLQEKLLSDISGSDSKGKINDSEEGMRRIGAILSTKKVLVVLDDVDKQALIKNLIGISELNRGSRVIITTRDIDTLQVEGSEVKLERYEMQTMDDGLALQLFCRHAFHLDNPSDDYCELSREIVSLLGGLPLAIEVVGSLLKDKKDKLFWKKSSQRLREVPNKEIVEKLRISYNDLDEFQKKIFLDIACFFFNEKKTDAIYMWESCKFYPTEEIEVLTNRCLIKILDNEKFWMHDQLIALGRQIVHEDSLGDLGKQSRLWIEEDILKIIQTQERKHKVQALQISRSQHDLVITNEKSERLRNLVITNEEFERLPNLRFLELCGGTIAGDFARCLSNLRWLHWRYPTMKDFMVDNLHLDRLVICKLEGANFQDDSKAWDLIKDARDLKVLSISNCLSITTIPYISRYTGLVRLTLTCCSLERIESFIGNLQSLIELKIEHCSHFTDLPEEVGALLKLKYFSLSTCRKLREFPGSLENLTSLIELDLSCTGITKLPNSIERLVKLEELNLCRCDGIKGEIPIGIGELSSLRILNLMSTSICRIPRTINMLQHLQTLNLRYCHEIQELPELPTSLICLFLESKSLLSVPNLSNLTNLVELQLRDGSSETEKSNLPIGSNLRWIGRLSRLEKLELNLLNIPAPADLASLSHLEELLLSWLELTNLEQLPSSLLRLDFQFFSIRTAELLPLCLRLRNLSTLDFYYGEVKDIPLEALPQLQKLIICSCKQLQRLSIPLEVRKLQQVSVSSCSELVEIQVMGLSKSLQSFCICKCKSLTKISGLPYLKNLENFAILCCNVITIVEGLHELGSLSSLVIRECPSLQRCGISLETYKEEVLQDISDKTKTEGGKKATAWSQNIRICWTNQESCTEEKGKEKEMEVRLKVDRPLYENIGEVAGIICGVIGGWKSILRDKNDVIVTGDVDPVELLRCLEKWFRTDVLSARLIEMA